METGTRLTPRELGKANGITVEALPSKGQVEVFSSKQGWTRMYANEINELSAALVKAQAKVKNASKDATNPHFKNQYANLESVWDAIREPFTSEGLAISQFPCEAPTGHVGLRTILIHKSGQFIDDKFFMPLKDPTNPQAAGSAITYARRYALMAVAGIAPTDDDGESANQVDEKPIVEDLEEAFEGAKSLDDRKAVYLKTKNSALSDATKTALLKKFGDVIKAEVK